jgi:hypothetical protein
MTYKMQGSIIACLSISPFACLIGAYRMVNNGRLPCVNTSDVDKYKVYPVIETNFPIEKTEIIRYDDDDEDNNNNSNNNNNKINYK